MSFHGLLAVLSLALALAAAAAELRPAPLLLSSSPPGEERKAQACSPLSSSPHQFRYASSLGCGHSCFQIKCSGNNSALSINSDTFLLLLGLHHNASLLLSLPLPPSDSSACASLPNTSIDFSGSPFRPSRDVCRHLAALGACGSALPSHFSSSPCRRSSWQNRLLSHPELLFRVCSRVAPSRSTSPAAARACRTGEDVAFAIAEFLGRGFVVEWNSSIYAHPYLAKCSSCNSSATEACGFNDSASDKPFLCFPTSENLGRSGSPASRRFLPITAFLFSVACVLLLFISLWAAAVSFRRRCRWGDHGSDPMTDFLLRHHIQQPIYSYEQLRASTNGFDPRRKIGDGGFGSVYLAHLNDGRVAAVKRLHRHHPAAAATKSFCNEILILSSLRHPNLVRLHGYCCDPRGLLLVYDYVPNGTLADHLHCSRSPYSKPRTLPWVVRLDIALQTAAAIEYLHFSLKPPVVHRDITSTNIFVERDMRVKVGDFGLSRLLTLSEPSSSLGRPAEYVCCTGPQGTPGYLDPEYHRSFRLTEKSDVYSFGVVLLELVTGLKAVDVSRHRSEMALVDMVVSKIHMGALHQVVDPVLLEEGKEVMAMAEAVVELAFRCVAGDKDDRPDARELVEELKRIRSKIVDPSKAT
ncbi:LOW QUALITY PROTEIN: LEAF RUST 10 DISEASE-RESISTANCE LOCUS RECEPTOR-LIKE PROTEIN KINASE-like 1.5 [Curcuma longa]|uniref:LOW QUALITY PROTEIN: LEAF RUST 10 DISEASE-RESISTANCE LOCUS RECEPTOR-LIKE PROTEIN KINASE-like 1.5 n=1 Tax=Curcuma longa TaxID=136217 RepID=UPI003D9E7917